MGGKISLHSFKAGLFNMNEEFDFDMNIEKGGIEKMRMFFKLDK
jgi:hypothetical protein